MNAVQDTVSKHHLEKFGKYYAPQILQPSVHHRLVEDLSHVVQVARIPPRFVYKVRASDYCSEAEIDWIVNVRKYRSDGYAGLMYTGAVENVEDRMMALVGAFLRNYIDARMLVIQEVVDRLKAGTMPKPSVVLVPNFFVGKVTGALPEWQVAMAHGWLMDRYAADEQTVLYVSDLKQLEVAYGSAVCDHIANHFVQVGE